MEVNAKEFLGCIVTVLCAGLGVDDARERMRELVNDDTHWEAMRIMMGDRERLLRETFEPIVEQARVNVAVDELANKTRS